MFACALEALAVTPPFKPRVPAPVATFPPVKVKEPIAPVKPFRSKRPELLMVTAAELASCVLPLKRTTSAFGPPVPSPMTRAPGTALPEVLLSSNAP